MLSRRGLIGSAAMLVGVGVVGRAQAVLRAQPESYDPEFADAFVALVDKLDPPAAHPTTE